VSQAVKALHFIDTVLEQANIEPSRLKMERRQHRRVEVDYWASLRHPLVGSVTGEIQDMSVSGLSLTLDKEMKFFVMMELDVRIHGAGWDETMPSLPVQVVRVQDREIALSFMDNCDDFWTPPMEDDLDLPMEDNYLREENEDMNLRI
jgi:hypothetical protein